MKIVHFTNNTIDGAGKAVYRLHRALRSKGIDSVLAVMEKTINDDSIQRIRPRFRPVGSFVRRCMPCRVKPDTLFNVNVPAVCLSDIEQCARNADILCLHSVQSFLSPELIGGLYKKTGIPFVWTVMDIEPLTGGCHFNGECDGFEHECGNCPQLRRPNENDVSRRNMRRKARHVKGLPVTFAAGSSWVRDHIKRSSLFRNNQIKNIFLSVDDIIYKDINKPLARKSLGLPDGKKIIAFGCFNFTQTRKGANDLLEALTVMPDMLPAGRKSVLKDVLLLTFGDTGGFSFAGAPCEWRHAGLLKTTQELCHMYHAADILAVPSHDDCGPLTVNEAFMCGLPVVAYDVGVSPDLIRSEQSGYVARRRDIRDYAQGIMHCLLRDKTDKGSDEIKGLRKMCTPGYQADQYIALCADIRKNKSREDRT
ncbi:MAG: glycosyltransferase [Candidatus Omnitrophica bacterium]|nr:glycosyltransferase [Candidatus Omnitrophota bacterium]